MISLFLLILFAEIIFAVTNPELFNTNYKMALSLNDEFEIASSRSLLSMNKSVESLTKSTPAVLKLNSKETSDNSSEPDSMGYINPLVNSTGNSTAEMVNSKEVITESYEKINFYLKRDSGQSMLVSMLNNKSKVWSNTNNQTELNSRYEKLKENTTIPSKGETTTSEYLFQEHMHESDENTSNSETNLTKTQAITVFQNGSESTITSQAYLINSSFSVNIKQNKTQDLTVWLSQDRNDTSAVINMVPFKNDNASLWNDSVLLEKYNDSFLNDSTLLENDTASLQNHFALDVNDTVSVWQTQIKNRTSVVNITYSVGNIINDTIPFVNNTVLNTSQYAANSDAPFGTKVPSTNCSKYLVPGSVTHEYIAHLRSRNSPQVNIHKFQNKIRKYFSDDADCSLVVTTFTSELVSWTDLHLNKSTLCVESRKQQLLENITNDLEVAPKFHKFFLPEFDIQFVNLSIYIECEHTESFAVVVDRALDIIVYVLGSCLLFSVVTVVAVFLKGKAKKSHTVDTSATPNTYQKYTLRSRRPVFMSPEVQRPVMLATCNPAYIDDETVEPKAKCFTET